MATLAGSPTSAYRLPARSAAGGQRWRHSEMWRERPALVQFVYLSMLLHAIAILLFGAPPGGSREGRAMWGALNVVLQGPLREAVPRIADPLPLPRLERELKVPPPVARKPVPAQRKEAPAKPAAAPTAPPAITAPITVPPVMQRIAPVPLKLDKALPTPRIEVIPMPVEAPPIALPAPMQPIAPDLPRVERSMAEPPKIEAPLANPVVPAPAPRPVEAAPPVSVPAPMQPLVPEAQSADRTFVEPPQITAPPAPVREEAAPMRAPAPPAPARPAPIERRDAPATDYDPTRPSIDLDEARRRAARMAREGTGQRALLPFPMPAPPERKTKTEEALEKARKPDCRTAYKDLGLLAAVPLIANEFGEGTCRW